MPDAPLFRQPLDLDWLARETAATRIDYCEVVSGGKSVFVHARDARVRDKLHKVNSITKSVLSLTIGIALERGDFPALATPIGDFFPEARTGDKANVAIEHLLTMTPGWDWPEMGDWGGLPSPMIDSPDWVRYVLSRPMKYKPGSRMFYDSGSSHLLSAILQKTSGVSTSAYAGEHLFAPLGIDKYRWPADAHGIDIGGFGLELRAPDLTKLARLMLAQGRVDDRQIVPAAWIEAGTLAYRHTYDHIGSYGYHWWVMAENDRPISPAIYFAMGYGGQYVFVAPELELAVVFASTLYKHTFHPYRLFKRLLRLDSPE
ncbi:serine hydrolase domain-containing protein [Paenibacillaceae bacterium WGS1546]|uniref:serine hydrolase domain-containing protein n=1 Tax=Cohnella sp. WGS1546 TaxID=3366810 RepID=UPI00372CFFD8